MTNNLDMAKIREKLGITQQVLADMLEVDRKYISMVETGTKPLSKKLAIKLERISEIQMHKRETSWETDQNGQVKNLIVKEDGNPNIPLPSECPNCARLESEVCFLRSALTSALDRIPKA